MHPLLYALIPEKSARRHEENPQKKRPAIHGVKNATPGDADQELGTWLDGIRPKSFTLFRKPSDCATPDLVCAGVLERYGGDACGDWKPDVVLMGIDAFLASVSVRIPAHGIGP